MLAAGQYIEAATEETGLGDFGGDSFEEGLEHLVESLAGEGELNEVGETIFGLRVNGALVNRLRLEETYRLNPEIEEERVAGPIVILGLPRTGTTATSQLIAADPADEFPAALGVGQPGTASRVGDGRNGSRGSPTPRSVSR